VWLKRPNGFYIALFHSALCESHDAGIDNHRFIIALFHSALYESHDAGIDNHRFIIAAFSTLRYMNRTMRARGPRTQATA